MKRRWRGPGRFPARLDSNIASAASRSRTSRATSITNLTTTISWFGCAPRRFNGCSRTFRRSKFSASRKAKSWCLGWGSTYGAITTAVEQLQEEGQAVSSAHLRHLNPFPSNLGEVLKGFETVIVPELNLGQLCMLIRAKFLVDAVSLSQVKGKPFKVSTLVNKIKEYL